MSERYSKLFALPENLYAVASPVVIAAGALLKDNQTGKVLAQLKLRNIGKKTIKAATVFVEPLDTVGKPLGAPVTYQYLDLHADRDADFGQKTPIALPDSATRSFAVSVVQVIFTDNSIWNDDSPAWKPLSRPKPLDALGDSELAKQFRIEYGGGCENLLLEQRDLWHCVCGAVNRQEEANCHKCGKALVELHAIDMEGLRKNKQERVAKERAEAELARKKAEIAAAKTKKIGTISAIAVAILVVIVVVANAISGMVKKNNAYNDAQLLLENGQYEEAIQAFSMLGSYKDSGEKVQTAQNEQKYTNAMAMLDAGMYDEAIEVFSELGDYRDSQERVLYAKYNSALALLEEKEYKSAYEIFEALGDYKDSKSYLNICQLDYLVVSETSKTNGQLSYFKEFAYSDGHLTEERITGYDNTSYFYGYSVSSGSCSAQHEYDVKGNLSTINVFNDDTGNEIHTKEYEYDSNGYLIKEVDNSAFPAGTHSWYAYKYDANGNMIKKLWYHIGEGEIYYSNYYEYDAMNQPVHYHYEYEWGLEGDESYLNEYDSQQNLIKQTVEGSTSNGNSYTKTYEYAYDDAGNCISKRETSDGYSSEYTYKYDSDGNLVKETYKWYSDGWQERVKEYTYDYVITYQPRG